MTMTAPQRVGFEIRAKRIAMGAGLRDMAGQIGVSHSYLNDIESGSRSPSEDVLVRIAECYEWDIGELRRAWERPDPASLGVLHHEPAVQLLKVAETFSREQWSSLIKVARELGDTP